MKFQIQTLFEDDLKHIARITPAAWGDVTPLYRSHFHQDYFFPIKLIFENQIIGVGELIVLEKNGWLGNIIVDKNFRNQGLGKMLTQHLLTMAKEKHRESIYLLATSLGKYVYQKLGFKEKGEYLFFQKNLSKKNPAISNNILPYEEKYKNEILALDKIAMGEDRSDIITCQTNRQALYLQDAFIYKKPNENHITGFFIPTLGNGLTICKTVEIGFDFIQKRESLGMNKIVLPEENKMTIQYLLENGYTEYREVATFMYLGKMKTWNPEMVICRIGGYLG